MNGAMTAVVALALPVSIAATNMALTLLTLSVLLSRPDLTRLKDPVLYGLLAYIAAGAASAAACAAPGEALRAVLKDAHKVWALGVFLVALKPGRRLLAASAAGFSLAAAAGLWESLAGHAARAHAFVHPVTFGEQMALAALGGLCFMARGSDAPRGPTAALTLLCLLSLALSETRGAAVGLAAGLVAAGTVERKLLRWLPVLAVAAAAAFFLRHRTVPTAPLLEARSALWDVAWRMFKDHPVLGVGPGQFRAQFSSYFHGSLEGEAVWGSAHDLYLHQLAERGLLGLAALLCLLGAMTWRSFRRAQRSSDAWSLWAFSAMAAFLVMNLTEVAWQVELMATLILFLWSIANAQTERPHPGL